MRATAAKKPAARKPAAKKPAAKKPAAKKPTAAPTRAVTRIGEISGPASWVAVVAADAARADGAGVSTHLGGCGTSDVYRVGDDALVMVEHYEGDDDADTEVALHRAIVQSKTRKPERIGAVEVTSGALALIAPHASRPRLAARALGKAAAAGAVTPIRDGLVVALPAGRYEVWADDLGEVEGSFGVIDRRVRIVPAGTPVLAGRPMATLARPMPPARPVARAAGALERRVIGAGARWVSVASMCVAPDGRAFAGENGGTRVCAWAANGELAWQREVAPCPKKGRPQIDLALAGDELLALKSFARTELDVLDAATGAHKRTLAIPDASSFAASPIHALLAIRTSESMGTALLAYPSLAPVAQFTEYTGMSPIAFSADGSWMAVCWPQVHTYDLVARRHVATAPGSKDSPWTLCFTPDGRLVTGGDKARIAIIDPARGEELAVGDGAPDRARKPTIRAIAASARHIAVGREDGTVALFDHALKLVTTWDKLHVELPGTEATTLAGIAFSDGGARLWISAGPKQAPIGLSIVDVP